MEAATVERLEQKQQLSFDVGGVQERPDKSIYKVSGSFDSLSERKLDDYVVVTIADRAGNVISTEHAKVSGVHFKKIEGTDTKSASLDRIHTVTLNA